jgi:hypothetical protein
MDEPTAEPGEGQSRNPPLDWSNLPPVLTLAHVAAMLQVSEATASRTLAKWMAAGLPRIVRGRWPRDGVLAFINNPPSEGRRRPKRRPASG